MEQQPVVYLITGAMAAGKSSVARLLASRFERGVHLEGDVFRRSIVGGREDMTPDPSPEALEQLRLRYRLAAAAADGYFQAGFSVALEDVVAGPLLGDYRSMVRSRPCHVVVLLPSPEAVRAREAGRAAKGYGAWTSRSSTTASSAGRHASASGSTRQTSPPRRRSTRSWPDELVHGASELDLTPYRLERSSGEAAFPETLVL